MEKYETKSEKSLLINMTLLADIDNHQCMLRICLLSKTDLDFLIHN